MAHSQQNKTKSHKQRGIEGRAKLTDQDKLEIRLSDEPAKEICKRYDVDYRTINWVRFARLWPNRE